MTVKELLNELENEQGFEILMSFYYDNAELLKALLKLDREEQLKLRIVNQQRELLINFLNWYDNNIDSWDSTANETQVDRFIKGKINL